MARKYYALKQLDIKLSSSKELNIVIKYITNGNKNIIENMELFINENDIENEKIVLFANMFYTQVKERKVMVYENELTQMLKIIDLKKEYDIKKTTKLYKQEISAKVVPYENFIEFNYDFKETFFQKMNKKIF